jgi:hypothetical protein
MTTSGHHRAQRQRGQATTEWAGVLLVVSLIVAAVVILPLGQNISHSLICNVEKILGNPKACQAAPSAAPNQLVCQTATQTNTSSDNVEVLFLKVGHNQTLIKTTYSDGEVQYTLTDSKQAELQAQPIQGELEVGSVGFDLEVKLAAGGALDGAHSWTFPNQQAAQGFENQVNSSGGWGQVAHDVAGLPSFIPGAGSVASWAGNGLLNLVGIHGAPDPNSLATKNLTYSYLGASAIGDATAKADAGLGGELGLQLQDELKLAAGARVITGAGPGVQGTGSGAVPLKKGDVQLFINLNNNANGALQDMLLGPNAGASAQTAGTAVVTLSPSGQLQQVQLTASSDVTGTAGDKPPEGGLAGQLGLKVNDGAGVGLNYTGTLNLVNNPSAKQALVSLLAGSSTPGGATPALAQLTSQMYNNSTQRVQPYTVSRSQGGAGAEGEILDVGGGAAATVSQQNQQFNAGWIKAPGQGWEPVTCKR